jgi:hypothetical protein
MMHPFRTAFRQIQGDLGLRPRTFDDVQVDQGKGHVGITKWPDQTKQVGGSDSISGRLRCSSIRCVRTASLLAPWLLPTFRGS